ncbi:AAA family ATPase [Ruminococcus gauvreauii]|uniref:Cytidylate kinase-like family protein n=1 Tax=Ruminococcus gauvreauii TaxID=438033 RepID=A0ABY5VJG0_9FIRM|nr:cytidylate kinase-like family protein [Ruminococcus gauvreauii]UWP60749.1 cytidylate kinase-like family protein [Ruminococcus gauvreauii]
MANSIITISREFGSGGRTIAKKVAEELEYAYYDKEIIEEVAQSTGYTPEYIAEAGEYSPTGNIFSYAFVGRDQSGISAADYLWIAQQKLILDIAKREPCVIVGRCADYILRDMEHVWNIFIHAPLEDRARRIVEKYGERDTSPEKRLRDKDKKRSVNYKYYTDQEWGKSQNYHLTLDSSRLGIDKCTDIITGLVH